MNIVIHDISAVPKEITDDINQYANITYINYPLVEVNLDEKLLNDTLVKIFTYEETNDINIDVHVVHLDLIYISVFNTFIDKINDKTILKKYSIYNECYSFDTALPDDTRFRKILNGFNLERYNDYKEVYNDEDLNPFKINLYEKIYNNKLIKNIHINNLFKYTFSYKKRYYENVNLTSNWWFNPNNVISDCTSNRLMQLSGTCWLMAPLNLFILNDDLVTINKTQVIDKEASQNSMRDLANTFLKTPAKYTKLKVIINTSMLLNNELLNNNILNLEKNNNDMLELFYKECPNGNLPISGLLYLLLLKNIKFNFGVDKININTVTTNIIIIFVLNEKELEKIEGFRLSCALLVSKYLNITHVKCGLFCRNKPYIYNPNNIVTLYDWTHDFSANSVFIYIRNT